VKEVAILLNAMREAGVISDYALFGAVAPDAVSELATRHELGDSWRRFEARFLSED
jgi:hypothetical protein